MNDESASLPRHLQVFLDYIMPVRQELCRALELRVVPVVEPLDFPARIGRLLEPFYGFTGNIEHLVNDTMGAVVQCAAAEDVEIIDMVRHFERELGRLLSGYRFVRELKVSGEHVGARDMLAGVYLHVLLQIEAWLGDVIEVLCYPRESLSKRGLSLADEVEISLDLILSAPPELVRLTAWADKRVAR
ncbi:MAG: hypothetical protein PHP85_02910 [Gallionella sp.]|nr:hypothetical protein [Gallionella sp.]